MSVAARLADVRERVARASAAADRAPPTLVAVSKGHPASAIRAAYAAGQRVFGESYAQEFATKAEALADLRDLEWRFIGHLQRNKTRLVLPRAHAIDSVDSLRLARRLDAQCAGTLPICLQINVSGEPSKRGVAPDGLPQLLEGVGALQRVQAVGLMTLPPARADPTPIFQSLVALAEAHALPVRSIGMSGDLEAAIAAGSTHVRVGTAIFGPRP